MLFLTISIKKLHSKNLGDLPFFLGIEVKKFPDCFLFTHAYTLVLQWKLSLTEETPLGLDDNTQYRSIVDALQYLTF